jgi:hypothetical protein
MELLELYLDVGAQKEFKTVVDMDCSNSPDVFTVDNMDVTSELKRDVSR